MGFYKICTVLYQFYFHLLAITTESLIEIVRKNSFYKTVSIKRSIYYICFLNQVFNFIIETLKRIK